MMCRPGFALVAALAVLVSAGTALARPRVPLDVAWQQALVAAGQAAEPLSPSLQRLADEGFVLDADQPGVRAALDAALAQRGLARMEQAVVLDALVRDIGETLGSARIVAVGPLEMTRADVATVAGPREGRDRAQVVLRLRARVPGASALSAEEATALVPVIVRSADSARAEVALSRIVAAMLERGAVQ